MPIIVCNSSDRVGFILTHPPKALKIAKELLIKGSWLNRVGFILTQGVGFILTHIIERIKIYITREKSFALKTNV